ncbi:MAG: hypothetical protein GXO71_02945 [Caldiserica bacterium]|nr:hypothetical protein [Caldisericota bacterium]
MKGFRFGLWVSFLLAILSVLVGFVQKLTGIVIGVAKLPAYPLSFLRFAMFCLLFAIALSLAEIALKK